MGGGSVSGGSGGGSGGGRRGGGRRGGMGGLYWGEVLIYKVLDDEI